MSIGTGVIGAVALQKIDNAPNAKASAESDNEGLQSVDCGSEKLHIYSFSPGTIPRPRKKPPRVGRQLPLGQLVSKSHLYKSVRIVKVIVVEDVLVLAYECLIRYGCFMYLTGFIQTEMHVADKGLLGNKKQFELN